MALRSADAAATLRCELHRSTCTSNPSRSYNALSPASEPSRSRGSPSDSSEPTLVAQPSVRNSFSPASSALSRNAEPGSDCIASTLWVRSSLRCQESPMD